MQLIVTNDRTKTTKRENRRGCTLPMNCLQYVRNNKLSFMYQGLLQLARNLAQGHAHYGAPQQCKLFTLVCLSLLRLLCVNPVILSFP